MIAARLYGGGEVEGGDWDEGGRLPLLVALAEYRYRDACALVVLGALGQE